MLSFQNNYSNTDIDAFFGKLTKNSSSKRIRTKTNASLSTFFPLHADAAGGKNNQLSLEQQPTSSSFFGGFLGFSSSATTTSEVNNKSSTPTTTATTTRTNQNTSQKPSPPTDPDSDLQKFQESAFYNSLHIEKLKESLHQEVMNTVAEEAPLRKELWHGVVEQPLLRAETWRLALGIEPATLSRRHRDAQRQILEYRDYLKLYYYCNMGEDQQLQKEKEKQQGNENNNCNKKSDSCMFPSITQTVVPPQDKRTKTEKDILYQLSIDLPRHKAALYFLPQLTERLRRCLFIWALRNPAVGYVQGMDDVVVVLYMTFLDEAFALIEPWKKRLHEEMKKKAKEGQQNENGNDVQDAAATVTSLPSLSEPEQIKLWLQLRLDLKGESIPNHKLIDGTRPWTEDVEKMSQLIALLPPCALDVAECDTYNCGGRFLSWGLDRYTFGQPGVLSCVDQIAAGVKMFDPELHSHIKDSCCLEFRTFAYKWVHLLLVRDLGQWLSMRLFDTMLSAGASGCWELFSYFCVAWLMSIREKVMHEVPADEALFFLQEPSKLGVGGLNGSKQGRSALRWIEELLSRAYLMLLQKKTNQNGSHNKNGMIPNTKSNNKSSPK